ncbi:hypothetical protein [Pseudaestuariivita atlantica]|uniref:hypothetical protein n=1 Tax=Pseudaestuariivita atlantica TaxID=1317121 RepID=UPI000A9CD9D8|nr:hypothetical protein [Pseudaestuariivita atlantica]
MSRTPDTPKDRKEPATRDERLKAALKANLARRKAQARVRGDTGGKPPKTGQD